jgi:hypothetical protein
MELQYSASYYNQLYDLTGSHKCALFVAQLLYWEDRNRKLGATAKTAKDWWKEIRLKPADVANCTKRCVELGILEVRLSQFNKVPTLYYKIDKELVMSHCQEIGLSRNSIMKKTDNQEISLSNNLVDLYQEIEETSTKKLDNPIIETITENIYKEPLTETSSVVPKLFNSDVMNQEAAKLTDKNKGAAPKSKPLKELSELDKVIAEKVKEIAERFKVWYLANKKIVYPYKRHDFVNLTGMFKDLCNNNGYTPDKVVGDITKIVTNYKKLSTFNQNNFSLNLIATKYNVLLSEIDTYKEPVERKNFGDPVAYVPTRLPAYYNGYPLPLGITYIQFIELGKLVYREKVMEGLIDEPNYSVYKFYDHYQIELKKITEPQLTQILKDYEII